jgi:CheY-like chemotaxis protein
MERELLEARKLEGLGTLAGGIAHEFNNILTGIMGYAELLSDGIEPSAVTRPYVDKIADLSHRAASLVSELLTFSNRMPSERHPVHLLPLVGEAVRTLRRTLPETIDIQWKASDRVATVKADISQVQQLIMNLASNARDAMPRGGSLVVALEDVALDAAASRLHLNARPGRYVRLSVRDTGTGMTPEVREQIFDPFFTTKDIGKGPGLGLATVHGIVKAHDGFISVSTELGKGSEFDVYLPAMEPAEGPQEVVSQAPHREGKTILLVEDDLAVLDVGREMLKSLGYNVLTARDGEEGLNTYRASGNEIDLVITDMEMPKMTGMDLCKALWRIDPQLKVILASAHNVREREAQLLTTGVRGFLQKPFGMRNLETTIRQALDIGALAGLEGQMVSGTAC